MEHLLKRSEAYGSHQAEYIAFCAVYHSFLLQH